LHNLIHLVTQRSGSAVLKCPSPEGAATVYVAASLLRSLALTGPASLEQRSSLSCGGPALHGAGSGLLAFSTRSGGSNALGPIRPVAPGAIHRTSGAATSFDGTGLTVLSNFMPQYRCRQKDGLVLRVWTPVPQGNVQNASFWCLGLDHQGMSALCKPADPLGTGGPHRCVRGVRLHPQGRPDLQGAQRPWARGLEGVASREGHEQLPREADPTSASVSRKLLLGESQSIPSSKAPTRRSATTAAAKTPRAPGSQATPGQIAEIIGLCQGLEERLPDRRDAFQLHIPLSGLLRLFLLPV